MDQGRTLRGLFVELSYKAAHHVASFAHPVHSQSHFHTWKVILKFNGTRDAHEIQHWMHSEAPHFGDHGDRGVEDVALWWLEHARVRWNTADSGVTISAVHVLREDGIGAFAEETT